MVGIRENFYLLLLFTFLIFVQSCVPVQPTSGNSSSVNYPQLRYENTTYDPDIKTVQLFRFEGQQQVALNNPTIALEKNEGLFLTFDDLSNQQQLYQAQIIHVNKDWTKKSQVLPMNYLEEYNQFAIRDYEYSFDTKVPYIHYSIQIPKVKVTGNYMLVVYRGSNPEDIVLSERFRVYENLTQISYKIVPSRLVKNRRNMQEVEFEVNLNGANILNRGSDIYPVVRQNNNELHTKYLQSPRHIESEKLIYSFFDGQLNFPGSNEFRFIDISTVNFRGTNIASINKESSPISMTAGEDNDRSNQAYREWEDRNGKFLIGNRERQTDELVNDYIDVTFRLDVAQQNEPIYIVGEFNNWELNSKSRLKYNTLTGTYENSYLLKQGYLEYLYYNKEAPHYEYEGSYVDTENEYDIAIYYSNPQLRYDQLIGYTNFNSRSARQNR